MTEIEKIEKSIEFFSECLEQEKVKLKELKEKVQLRHGGYGHTLPEKTPRIWLGHDHEFRLYSDAGYEGHGSKETYEQRIRDGVYVIVGNIFDDMKEKK